MNVPSKVAILAVGISVAGASLAGAAQLTPSTPLASATETSLTQIHMNGEDRGPREGRRHGRRGEHGQRDGRRGGPRHGMRRGPGGPGMGALNLRGMMKAADTDGDRALTQDEIDAFIATKVAIGDADGNGDVTLAEFEAIWLDLTRQAMVRSFQRLDRDGDATVTAVEIDERFGSVVEMRDRNDDGKLDRADHRRGKGGKRGGRRGPMQDAPAAPAEDAPADNN